MSEISTKKKTKQTADFVFQWWVLYMYVNESMILNTSAWYFAHWRNIRFNFRGTSGGLAASEDKLEDKFAQSILYKMFFTVQMINSNTTFILTIKNMS